MSRKPTLARVSRDSVKDTVTITRSLKLPKGNVNTTKERSEGALLYNTPTNSIYYYDGTDWLPLATTTNTGDLTVNGQLTINGQSVNSLVTLADSATIVSDMSTGNVKQVTLAGNRTLANPINLAAGANYIWIIRQDGIGNRTLGYGAAFKFALGITPTLSTTPGAVDLLTGVTDGTNVYANLLNNFS